MCVFWVNGKCARFGLHVSLIVTSMRQKAESGVGKVVSSQPCPQTWETSIRHSGSEGFKKTCWFGVQNEEIVRRRRRKTEDKKRKGRSGLEGCEDTQNHFGSCISKTVFFFSISHYVKKIPKILLVTADIGKSPNRETVTIPHHTHTHCQLMSLSFPADGLKLNSVCRHGSIQLADVFFK